MNVACAKGCGHTVPVSKEDLDEMLSSGSDIVVAHETCPTDPDAPKRTFKVVTSVYEVLDGPEDEKLASMGDEVEGVNFTESVERLGAALQSQWERIVGLAETIDLPVEDPNPPQDTDLPPGTTGRLGGAGDIFVCEAHDRRVRVQDGGLVHIVGQEAGKPCVSDDDPPPVGYGRCKGCGVQEPIEVLRQMDGYHSSECARDDSEKE